MLPTTTRHGFKIGDVTNRILFHKYQPRLSDEEQRQQADYVKKHHQERLDLVDAIEVCASAKNRVLRDYINGRYQIGGVVIRSHGDFLGQELLNRVVRRLNNKIVSLYGTVISA